MKEGKTLLQKYEYLFLNLKEMDDLDNPYPQRIIYNALSPLIKEIITNPILKIPYRQILIRLKTLLNKYNIHYIDLKYNTFYFFLKKNNFFKETKTADMKPEKQEEKKRRLNLKPNKDLLEEIKEI